MYNAARFLRGAIDSILAQTFGDFELIISDNHSTDDTEAICREFACGDRRVRYVRQSKNIGAIANFRYVLDGAVGKYFMWAAADDRRHCEFVELALRVLEDDAGVGLVFCDMYTVDLNTDSRASAAIGYSGSGRKYKKYLFRLLNGCPSLIYGLHRIDVLRRVGLEDYDFFDVYLTHWYELNSAVKTIPLYLYTAGTDGVRTPYSLSGHEIDTTTFLRHERRLLREHFGRGFSGLLFLMAWCIYKRNAMALSSAVSQDKPRVYR